MNYILMALSVFAGTAKSLLSKGLNKVNRNRFGLALSNTYIFFASFCAILLFSFITGLGTVSVFSVILGILCAVTLMAGQFLYMEALSCGTVSVTAFIYSCGFLIPTVAGFIFWDEAVTLTKAAGILILLAAFFLISYDRQRKTAVNGTKNPKNLKWKICSFAAMTSSGLLGIFQKVHQMSDHKDELCSYLLISMSGALILSLALAFLSKKGRFDVTYTKGSALIAVSCGIIYGVANILNLKLAGLVPATLLFPVTNGGGIVLTTFLGGVLFKERLSLPQKIGILLGILAILIISR